MAVPEDEVMFQTETLEFQVILICHPDSILISLGYFLTQALYRSTWALDDNVDMEAYPRLIEFKYLKLGPSHCLTPQRISLCSQH